MIPAMWRIDRLRLQSVAKAFFVSAMSIGFAMAASAQSAGKMSRVPFVGCASDGQVGPVDAPTGPSPELEIPLNLAQRLAYYRAQYGFGVLAPRGWRCFSTYGSNGSSLYVTPEAVDAAELFSSDWRGFAGSAIQVSVSEGDTSGRFEVAKVIARVFPAEQQFVRNVIAEGIEPASSFPSGPYAQDKLTYRGQRTVEFETPPEVQGLGTQSRLLANPEPIRGVAILFGEEPNLVLISARLPKADRDLAPIIIQQVENDVRGAKNHD